MRGVHYTGQQTRVIQSKAKRIKVVAYSGTGKSSTLVGYAEARPERKMLYLAYNAAIAAEAKIKFPSNVECRTGHSLAFSKAQPYIERNGGKGLGDVKGIEVARAMQAAPMYARMSLSALANYFNSADRELTIDHVKEGLDPGKETSEQTIANILDLTKALWKRIQDPKDVTFKMPHDGYLKLFQLSNPDLSRFSVILFDEAQDANPVITEIIKSQKTAGIVTVGDKHQSIYGFRGAENSLDNFDAEESFILSKSFRFGHGVGTIASLLLKHWKEESVPVEGLGRHRETNFVVDKTKPYAQLCRTNAILLDLSVELIAQNKKIHFIGGPERYRFNLILDAYNLWNGKADEVRAPSLKLFPSWSDFKLFSEESNDPEYKILIKVVEKYGLEIPKLVDKVKSSHQENKSNAEVILCTGHRAKGLEFDQVIMSDDFADLMDTENEPDAQEINLLYVAATRAERCLEIPASMQDWLASIGEPLHKIIRDQKLAIAAERANSNVESDSDTDSVSYLKSA